MSYIWLQGMREPNPDQIFLFAYTASAREAHVFLVEKSRSS